MSEKWGKNANTPYRAYLGYCPEWLCENGRTGEIRTRDQRIKSPLLYRLSYRPIFMAIWYAFTTMSLDYLLFK